MKNKNDWKLDGETIIARCEGKRVDADQVEVPSLMEHQQQTEAYTLSLSKSLYAEAVKKRGLGVSEAGNIAVGSMLLQTTELHKEWVDGALRGKVAVVKRWFRNSSLQPEQVCFIALTQMMNSLREYNIQTVAERITTVLLDAGHYQQFQDEAGGLFATILDNVKSSTARHKHRVLTGAATKIAKIPLESMAKDDKIKIGTRMIQTVIEATGLFEIKQVIEGQNNTPTRLFPTGDLTASLDELHGLMEVRNPYNLPMIVPPRPWTDLFEGGYWFSARSRENGLIKGVNTRQLETLVNHDWTSVFRQVNRIQATAWRVNTSVLEVLKQCMDRPYVFAKIPSCELKEIPRSWGDLPDDEWKQWQIDNKEEANAWKFKQASEHDKFNRGISKRDAVFRSIGIAEQFRFEEEIYFPYQLDSRGRAYPTSAVLSPQTGDVAQGLLELAEGKALGVDGIRWLLIDLANCWGEDKVTLSDRATWAMEHYESICLYASDPIEHDGWAEADKPFNFLARCIALRDAFLLDDPTTYISHLGGQLDGSNNGCQHFGAMMKDADTCKAVNVTPTDTPSDVYQIVADAVQPLVDADIEAGGEWAVNKDTTVHIDNVATPWIGKLNRSVVKQPTMTTPYGVTMRGVDGQLQEFVKKYQAEKGVPFTNPHPEGTMKQACSYLASKVDEAITTTMLKAKTAMFYLQDTAEEFSKQTNMPITWETPNGFLVVQDRRRQQGKRVELYTGGSKLRTSVTVNSDTPNIHPQKARSGIAPNFVHSLDACHMLKTVDACWDRGISSFSLIHDSYGVHHADLTEMRNVLREQFVDMYADSNVLDTWRDQVVDQLPEDCTWEIPQAPEQGDADISKVLGSEYFFA